ncbi:MAG: hypothetical protein BKP49_11070 [Treponema sp. CETP13]|nr:MAG: hypothetical protein BKP49_11070 [Treponema sp. CETP13]
MEKQYRTAHDKNTDIVLVIDSSCDLPAELLDKSFVHLIPLKSYLAHRTILIKLLDALLFILLIHTYFFLAIIM